jgi:hypothetical protein
MANMAKTKYSEVVSEKYNAAKVWSLQWLGSGLENKKGSVFDSPQAPRLLSASDRSDWFAFHSTCTGVKRQEREADGSPPSSTEK